MKPNIRIARGQPTTVDIHVIHLPRGIKTPLSIKIGAGLVEIGRGTVGTFSRVTAGIEPASPTPRIFVRRNAGADRDRADAHVTIVDVPAFVGSIERAAAGEGGHVPMIPPI